MSQIFVFSFICIFVGISAYALDNDVRKTTDFASATLTAINPKATPSGRNSPDPTIKTPEIKKTAEDSSSKSSAKPDELDKARTHTIGVGLQGIIDSIRNKLSHTSLVPGYPVSIVQPAAHYVQPVSTQYVQQPYSYYNSYSSPSYLPSASVISSPSHVISSPASYLPSASVISSPSHVISSSASYLPSASVISSPSHVISSPGSLFSSNLLSSPTNVYSSPASIAVSHPAPIAVSHTTVTKPVVSYNSQVFQKPAYTISQQVIHKPVYTEIQEVIHKPVYTEVQEIIHKPVITELQQVIKKPLYTEHVVKKPLYNSVHQEIVARPLQLQTEQYHVVDKPISQFIQLPQQIVQPYTNHIVQTPVYHQQAISSTSYHVPAVTSVASIPSASISSPSFGYSYAPYSSPLGYLSHLPYSSSISSPAYSSYVSSPAISTVSAVPSVSAVNSISAVPAISSVPTISSVQSPVNIGYSYGINGALGGFDDNHYQYYTASTCRSGNCGSRSADGKDGSEFFQQMNYQPEFQNFPSMTYGIPSGIQNIDGGSFMTMPYMANPQPLQRSPSSDKGLEGKSATSDDGTSSDSSSYLVPSDSQGAAGMQSPDQSNQQYAEEYLKSAIDEEENRRSAIKSDLDNLEDMVKKIQEDPEALSKIKEIVRESMSSKDQSTKSKTLSSVPTETDQTN